MWVACRASKAGVTKGLCARLHIAQSQSRPMEGIINAAHCSKARTGIRSCRQHPTLGICRQAHGHPQPPLRRGGTPHTRIHTSTQTPDAFMPHALCGTQEAAGLYVQAPFAGSVLQGVYCRAHGRLCMPQQLQHWLRLQLDTAGTQALATRTQAHAEQSMLVQGCHPDTIHRCTSGSTIM